MSTIDPTLPPALWEALFSALRQDPHLVHLGQIFCLDALVGKWKNCRTYRLRVYDEATKGSTPLYHRTTTDGTVSHYLKLKVPVETFDPGEVNEQMFEEIRESVRIHPERPASIQLISWIGPETNEEEGIRVCVIDTKPEDRVVSLSQLVKDRLPPTSLVGDLLPYMTADGHYTGKEALLMVHMTKVQATLRELGSERKYTYEHPAYPRTDWQHDVANGDTGRAYWDWVDASLEADACLPRT